MYLFLCLFLTFFILFSRGYSDFFELINLAEVLHGVADLSSLNGSIERYRANEIGSEYPVADQDVLFEAPHLIVSLNKTIDLRRSLLLTTVESGARGFAPVRTELSQHDDTTQLHIWCHSRISAEQDSGASGSWCFESKVHWQVAVFNTGVSVRRGRWLWASEASTGWSLGDIFPPEDYNDLFDSAKVAAGRHFLLFSQSQAPIEGQSGGTEVDMWLDESTQCHSRPDTLFIGLAASSRIDGRAYELGGSPATAAAVCGRRQQQMNAVMAAQLVRLRCPYCTVSQSIIMGSPPTSVAGLLAPVAVLHPNVEQEKNLVFVAGQTLSLHDVPWHRTVYDTEPIVSSRQFSRGPFPEDWWRAMQFVRLPTANRRDFDRASEATMLETSSATLNRLNGLRISVISFGTWRSAGLRVRSFDAAFNREENRTELRYLDTDESNLRPGDLKKTLWWFDQQSSSEACWLEYGEGRSSQMLRPPFSLDNERVVSGSHMQFSLDREIVDLEPLLLNRVLRGSIELADFSADLDVGPAVNLQKTLLILSAQPIADSEGEGVYSTAKDFITAQLVIGSLAVEDERTVVSIERRLSKHPMTVFYSVVEFKSGIAIKAVISGEPLGIPIQDIIRDGKPGGVPFTLHQHTTGAADDSMSVFPMNALFSSAHANQDRGDEVGWDFSGHALSADARASVQFLSFLAGESRTTVLDGENVPDIDRELGSWCNGTMIFDQHHQMPFFVVPERTILRLTTKSIENVTMNAITTMDIHATPNGLLSNSHGHPRITINNQQPLTSEKQSFDLQMWHLPPTARAQHFDVEVPSGTVRLNISLNWPVQVNQSWSMSNQWPSMGICSGSLSNLCDDSVQAVAARMFSVHLIDSDTVQVARGEPATIPFRVSFAVIEVDSELNERARVEAQRSLPDRFRQPEPVEKDWVDLGFERETFPAIKPLRLTDRVPAVQRRSETMVIGQTELFVSLPRSLDDVRRSLLTLTGHVPGHGSNGDSEDRVDPSLFFALAVEGFIVNQTTLVFRRSDSSIACDIDWQLVEFASGAHVYQSSFHFMSNYTITDSSSLYPVHEIPFIDTLNYPLVADDGVLLFYSYRVGRPLPHHAPVHDWDLLVRHLTPLVVLEADDLPEDIKLPGGSCAGFSELSNANAIHVKAKLSDVRGKNQTSYAIGVPVHISYSLLYFRECAGCQVLQAGPGVRNEHSLPHLEPLSFPGLSNSTWILMAQASVSSPGALPHENLGGLLDVGLTRRNPSQIEWQRRWNFTMPPETSCTQGSFCFDSCVLSIPSSSACNPSSRKLYSLENLLVAGDAVHSLSFQADLDISARRHLSFEFDRALDWSRTFILPMMPPPNPISHHFRFFNINLSSVSLDFLPGNYSTDVAHSSRRPGFSLITIASKDDRYQAATLSPTPQPTSTAFPTASPSRQSNGGQATSGSSNTPPISNATISEASGLIIDESELSPELIAAVAGSLCLLVLLLFLFLIWVRRRSKSIDSREDQMQSTEIEERLGYADASDGQLQRKSSSRRRSGKGYDNPPKKNSGTPVTVTEKLDNQLSPSTQELVDGSTILDDEYVLPPSKETATKARNKFRIDPSDLGERVKCGEGSFGLVYKSTWRGAQVAIKEVKRAGARKDLLEEAEGMKNIRPHANIVQFFGIVDEPFAIVTEFAAMGSLDDLLYHEKVERRRRFSSAEKQKICLGVVRGVLHLHLEKFIHRDLAARNVLLDSKGRPKIADFGMVRLGGGNMTEEHGNEYTRNTVGPLKWMAPEQMQHQHKLAYSFASDIWSTSVILYEIYAEEKPWGGLTTVQAAQRVMNGETLPPVGPAPVQQAMLHCFQWEPKERPSAKELYAHVESFSEAAWVVENRFEPAISIDESNSKKQSPFGSSGLTLVRSKRHALIRAFLCSNEEDGQESEDEERAFEDAKRLLFESNTPEDALKAVLESLPLIDARRSEVEARFAENQVDSFDDFLALDAKQLIRKPFLLDRNSVFCISQAISNLKRIKKKP